MKKRIFVTLLSVAVLITSACDNNSKKEIIELISYSTNVDGGDNINRGFYIEAYPGTTLDTVTLWFQGGAEETFAIKLTARAGTYDGTVLATDTQEISLDTTTFKPCTFEMGNVDVEKGSIVTFTMEYANSTSSVIFYGNYSDEIETLSEEALITQTVGTDAPLDEKRGDGVSIIVKGAE